MRSPVEMEQPCIVKGVIKGGHGLVHNCIEFVGKLSSLELNKHK